MALVQSAQRLYSQEKAYLVKRAETTEALAGVGLSIETAAHDIMAMMRTSMFNLDALIQNISTENDAVIDKQTLNNQLLSIRGGFGFIRDQLQNMQSLFTSSKQRRKRMRISESIDKVSMFYKKLMNKEKIEFRISAIGSPLVVKSTDAVILQLLINLFDNAIYWLREDLTNKDKTIQITLNGDTNQMIFSDNGPGVRPDDIAYIFEPFYSGKGEEGRGLGLYIARQLLDRSDATIELANYKDEQILPGANFVINFSLGDNNG